MIKGKSFLQKSSYTVFNENIRSFIDLIAYPSCTMMKTSQKILSELYDVGTTTLPKWVCTVFTNVHKKALRLTCLGLQSIKDIFKKPCFIVFWILSEKLTLTCWKHWK